MKAKYTILRFVLIFAIILGLGSCEEDFLQTIPTDAVSNEIALGSSENMMLAMNGIHRSMYAQNGFVGNYAGQEYMIPYSEFGASDAMHSKSGNGWHRARAQWISHTNANAGDIEFAWWFYYNVIGSANNIINAADDLQMSAELHNVLGQAYTYRAWAHFQLVQYFGKAYMIGSPATDLGVPIMTATEPPYQGKERNTVQQVYDQIIDDLDAALLNFADASSRKDLSHLNIDVANGVAARVYLTIGNWPKAATYANAARQEYTLMSEAQYKSGFNSWENPEWIWGSKMISDQSAFFYSYFYYVGNNFNGSQNKSNPKFINHLLYDLISDTDYRQDLFLKDAPSTFDKWDKGENTGRFISEAAFKDSVLVYRAIVNNTSAHNMVPYMHIKMQQSDGPTTTPMDVIHMRASEMYLIEAEALARQTGFETQAQDVLFELVSERDAAYVKSTNTGQLLVDEILIQRRIELWIEGFRWFDMLRNDEVLDLAGSGVNPDLYLAGMYQDKPSVNPKWVFLIPQREINANPTIIQNVH